MKPSILVLPALWIVCSCMPSGPPESEPGPSLDQMDWLIGPWWSGDDSITNHEVWERQSDTLMGGFGFVKQGDSVLFTEVLAIAKANDTLLYRARVEGQNDGRWVSFRIVEADSAGFTSVNPAHDFPTRITYRHFGSAPDDSLQVVISGPGKDNKTRESRFSFIRKK